MTDLESRGAYQIMSYYNCGTSGTQNCQIAYTENVGSCSGNSNIVRASALDSLSDKANFTNWLRTQMGDGQSGSQNHCTESAEAFKLWLAKEIEHQKLRNPSAKG